MAAKFNGEHIPAKLIPSEIKTKPVISELSVVIPTLGREILEECLHWIATGTVWPGALIIVDQGESSQVGAWVNVLQSIGIQAIHLPSSQRGRAAGVNRGLERVQTRFAAITDDDCFVESDWLEQMLTSLQNNPGTIVTGRVEPAGNDMIVVVTSKVPAVYSKPRLKFDSLSGGNMGTSMAVIERVGLFDEDPILRTAEDGEWAYRALKTGVPIMYAPDVVVRHFGWRDKTKRSIQYLGYARSQGGFYGKYIHRGDLFIALRAILHHVRAFRRWVRGTLTGNDDLAHYGRAYFTGLLPGIIIALKKDSDS